MDWSSSPTAKTCLWSRASAWTTRYWTGFRSWNSSTSTTSQRERTAAASPSRSSSSAALMTSVSKSTSRALREKTLILLEQDRVVVQQRVAAEAMRGEARERVAMPAARSFDAAQRVELILLVGDAEARLEQHVGAELAEQLGAEGVDGAALDLRRGVAESSLESMRDLAGGLVRERERADARRIECEVFDQEVNALGEAIRLAGAGAGEDEQRAGSASIAARCDGEAMSGTAAEEPIAARAAWSRPPMLDAHGPGCRVEVEVYFVARGELLEGRAFNEVVDVRVVDTATGAVHRSEGAANAVAGELHVERAVEVIEALCGALRDLETTVERCFS